MAKMKPAFISPETGSKGERDLFRRLKEEPETANWIVLHSLDVANHGIQIWGEVDFVVIIPNLGVLCVEVKATSRVYRSTDGLWYYGSDPKGDPDGPFKQASRGMHAVREALATRRADLRRIPFWSVVIFPFTTFRDTSQEWHSWQVIDERTYDSKTVALLLSTVLIKAREFLLTVPSATWFDPTAQTPTAEQCEGIAAALRPDVEAIASPRLELARARAEVKRYTEEQFSALDGMEDNPRAIFTGPAGTGKTVLALEAARRARADKRAALCLCFNSLLGQQLKAETEGWRDYVTTGTLHAHMLRVAGIEPPSAPTTAFFEEELPPKAIDALLQSKGERWLFDEVILDEAQDVLRLDRPQYLDFLDLSLKDGLKKGRWRLFGDFENQVIYGSQTQNITDFVAKYGAGRYSLRVNCRNTPRIAAAARVLGGLLPDYRRVLREDDKREPRWIDYQDAENEQMAKLAEVLEQLRDDGFAWKDIVVLSFHGDSTSVAARLTSDRTWRDRLAPIDAPGRKAGGFCSVHRFKGCEAPAVVLTDVDHVTDAYSQSLFYVGVTRALHRLVVLANRVATKEARSALLGIP